MSPRDLAMRAFWSDQHPLGHLYAIAHGQWIDGAFVPCSSWSARELKEFAAALPPSIIASLAGDHHGQNIR